MTPPETKRTVRKRVKKPKPEPRHVRKERILKEMDDVLNARLRKAFGLDREQD